MLRESAGRPGESVRSVLEEDEHPGINILTGVNENGITEDFNDDERCRDSEDDFRGQPEEMLKVDEEGGLFVDSENDRVDIRITTANKGKGKEIIPQPIVKAASVGSENDCGSERVQKPSISEAIANTDDNYYQIPEELNSFDLNAMIRDRLRAYRLNKAKGTEARD